MTQNKELIVEDVLYFLQEGDEIRSIAKDTFYYQFLMRRAGATPIGETNRRAAEDFERYQRIFLYLMQQGYLTDNSYCIDFDPIEGGACFSLNLGKLLEEIDLEKELNEHFEGQMMGEYIHTLCAPVESLHCIYCGSFSFSRFIRDEYRGRSEACCLACHPLKPSIKEEIKDEYNRAGSQAAVIQRLALIEKYSQVQIPAGKSINSLVADFRRTYKTDVEDVLVTEIRNILDELQLNNFDVFTTGDYDVLLLNMEAIQDLDVFSEIVACDYETAEIIVFFPKEGVCMFDDDAVAFVKNLRKEAK